MYLIDSITGNIVYSVVHRRARKPIQVVHSENWVIVSLWISKFSKKILKQNLFFILNFCQYSYYNDKVRRNEISSIELYEGFDQLNSTAFSSLGRDLLMIPLVEQKTFIFPTGIGIMTDTETHKGITNKHILSKLFV